MSSELQAQQFLSRSTTPMQLLSGITQFGLSARLIRRMCIIDSWASYPLRLAQRHAMSVDRWWNREVRCGG
jgi:hypothetical protein